MKTKKLEVKKFGKNVKVAFLKFYSDNGPTLYDLEQIRKEQFAGVSAKKLRLWTDNEGRIYFGTGWPTTKEIKPGKWVLHHDDSPCNARLENRHCPVCNFAPDMQSTCLYLYCPTCDCRLENMACPECKGVFKRPDR